LPFKDRISARVAELTGIQVSDRGDELQAAVTNIEARETTIALNG
jgi:hypothetical protein